MIPTPTVQGSQLDFGSGASSVSRALPLFENLYGALDSGLNVVSDGFEKIGNMGLGLLQNLIPSSSAHSNSDVSVGNTFDSVMEYLNDITRSEGTQLDKNMEYNAQQAAATRQFNAAEAQKNRDFQERMSNTSYQRAMQDMLAAGLNPILAFQQGGASTPSGSSASSNSASMSTSGGVKLTDLIYLLSVLSSPLNSALAGSGGSALGSAFGGLTTLGTNVFGLISSLINLIPVL